MTGISDLDVLLSALSPVLQDGRYVYCTFSGAAYGDHAEWQPLASIREPEGLTLVIDQETADGNGLGYEGIFRCITLGVHSSLQAVGLTAAVSDRLAQQQISANVIAGYYHDHVLVEEEYATKALALLSSFAAGAKSARR